MRKFYLLFFFCIPSILLSMTLSVPVVQNAAGTTLDLPIRIADPAGGYISQYQFNFTFDPEVVTVSGVQRVNSLSENWITPAVIISDGICSVSAAGNQPISANGVLVFLRLAVKSTAPVGAVSPLQIPFAQLNNGAIEPEIVHGSLQVVADGQPPEFKDEPRVISVTTTSAKIFWETNEPATAEIFYGINKSFSEIFTSNEYQIRHEVELSGLKPGQSYFYRIQIRDKSGNGPVSSLDYQFETDALYFKLNVVKGMPGSQIEIPLEISDVAGLGIQQLQGQLSYNSDLLVIRQLSTAGCVSSAWRMPHYSMTNGTLDFSLANSVALETGGTLLRLVFDIPDSAKFGTVIPLSWQNAALNSGDIKISTMPGTVEVCDVQPPELVSSVEIMNLSATSAVLTWQTNEAARGTIRYGTSPTELTTEQTAAAYLAKQRFSLTGLTPNQNYWVQLELKDDSGNAAKVSELFQFTTLPAEKIHVKLADGDISPGERLRVALSLQNPEEASIFSYVTAIQFDSDVLSISDVISPHTIDADWDEPEWNVIGDAVTIRNSGESPIRDSGTVIILEVQANDNIVAEQNTDLCFVNFQLNQGLPDVSTQDGQLHVLGVPDNTAPAVSGAVSVDQITPTSAVVFWQTDERADAQVIYWAENAPQQEVYHKNTFEFFHDIELSGLTPNTRYSYRVLGRDPSGNLYRGGDNGTFTTPTVFSTQLRVPKIQQSAGSTFTLPVYLTQVAGTEVRDIDFTLNYDRTVVFAGDVLVRGSLIENWAVPQITLTQNTVRIRVKAGLPLNGSGQLLQIYFQVLDDVNLNDACFFTLSNVLLNQGQLPVSTGHGRVVIGDADAPDWHSLPAVTELQQTSAQIFWQTDEPATGTVFWGDTPALGQQATTSRRAYSQIVPLTNLQPGQSYFYRTESYDMFGNGPLTSSLQRFETPARPEIHIDLPDSTLYGVNEFSIPIEIVGPTNDNPIFEIEGRLKFPAAALSYQGVVGGVLPDGWEIHAELTAADLVLLKLTGIKPLCESAIISSVTFALKEKPAVETDFAFNWTDISINRTTGNIIAVPGNISWQPYQEPQFLQGPVVSETNASSTRIYFKTDEPVTARLKYGLTDDYGMVLEHTAPSGMHTFYLYGLVSERIYHYQIEITAPDGQQNIITDARFLTTGIVAPRAVLADTVLPIGKTFSLPIYLDNAGELPLQQFRLTVEFDADYISPAGISREGTMCQDWEMGINQLTESKIQITGAGNSPLRRNGRLIVIQGIVRQEAEPGEMTTVIFPQFSFNFGTEPAYTKSGQIQLVDAEWPQFVNQPKLLRTSETTASVQWTANEPAFAQIMFGPDSIAEYTQDLNEAAVENMVTLSDLETGIGYVAKVGLTDAAGHGPVWSSPVYFTPQEQPVGLEIPETKIARGMVHELPIMIHDLAGAAISEYQLQLEFDTGVLTPIGVSSRNSLSAKWGEADFSLSLGQIHISHSGDDTIKADGILCWVLFFANSAVAENSTTEIRFINSIFDALPVHSLPGQLTVLAPADDSELHMALPDTAVAAGSWFEIPIRISDLSHRSFREATFQLCYDSTLLAFDGVNVENTTSSLSDITWHREEDGVQMNVINPEPWNGSGTWMRLKFHLKSDMKGSQSTQLALKHVEFNSNLQMVVTESADISIIRWADTISGAVVENDNTTPVRDAVVTLTDAGGSRIITTSNWSGKFHFSSLAPEQQYHISAAKEGFPEPANLENIPPGGDEQRMLLFRENGLISGTVHTPTGYPVAGSTILLNSESTTISTTSDTDGSFDFTNVNYQSQFKMSIGAAGFLSQSYYQISADTLIACTLEPLNSSVSGRVIEQGNSVAGLCLSLIRQPENCFYDSVRTGADGLFEFQRVMPGSYRIQIAEPGYLSANPDVTFDLRPEGRVWVDVPVKKAVVAFLEMTGAEQILSGARTRYRLAAFSADGENLPVPNDISWNLQPATAGEVQNGIFYPAPGFFSVASLSARSDVLTVGDSLDVVIAAPLTPDTDKRFTDGNGFQLQVSPGAVGEEITVSVSMQTPFTSGNSQNGWQPAGTMYELLPNNYSFSISPEITLPAAAGTPVENCAIGKWRSESRDWVPVGGIPAGQAVTGPINSTGRYALIASPHVLGITDVNLCPNPFSPMVDTDGDGEAGLAIQFIATSAVSMTPEVTLEVYNLTGQLVRTLWDQRVVEKATPLVARWDGVTEHQRMARNGRYLLKMEVSDDSGTKGYWHSIVLLK